MYNSTTMTWIFLFKTNLVRNRLYIPIYKRVLFSIVVHWDFADHVLFMDGHYLHLSKFHAPRLSS